MSGPSDLVLEPRLAAGQPFFEGVIREVELLSHRRTGLRGARGTAQAPERIEERIDVLRELRTDCHFDSLEGLRVGQVARRDRRTSSGYLTIPPHFWGRALFQP